MIYTTFVSLIVLEALFLIQNSDDFSGSTDLLSLLADIFTDISTDISSIGDEEKAELLSEIRSSQASVLSSHLISLLSTVTGFMGRRI